MKNFREHFDIEEGLTYLNTPGNGLLPRDVRTWRTDFDHAFYASGSDFRERQDDFLKTVKDEVASFFNSSNENTFLTPNFSFAFNSLINLLPSNFRYLLLEDEYPSLAYPLKARRLQHHTVSVESNLEQKIFESIERYQPEVFVVSLVQYISGLRIDLNFLKELKLHHPKLLILADGTQFLGTTAFRFEDSGIDALAASGYKWLLSGFGNGFILFSNELKDRLETGLTDTPAPVAPMWKGKDPLTTFFEPGHQDNVAQGTLREGLRFLRQLGMTNVEQYVQDITRRAHHLLSDRGWLLPYIKDREVQSPLINIQVSPSLYPILVREGVACYPRGSGIRIGIHLYNDLSDVKRFIELIERNNEV